MSDRETFEAWLLSRGYLPSAEMWEAWQGATALEREACAKQCDARAEDTTIWEYQLEAERCAEAIRARSKAG